MIALYIYLAICLAIFVFFVGWGIFELFVPARNQYEGHSLTDLSFWIEVFWMSTPVVNLLIILVVGVIYLETLKKE